MPILTTVALLKIADSNKDLLKKNSVYIVDELKNNFEIGLNKYIADRISKVSNTKTFLSNGENVDFYNVYFPLSLLFKGKKISTDSIYSDIVQNKNCVGITGIAGSGKTMIIKHLFLQACTRFDKIPILIELRDLTNVTINLKEYIISLILNSSIKPSSGTLDRALGSGDFLFLFDGFDEIALDKKSFIVNEIEQFIDNFNNNTYVISSRPGAGLENMQRFHIYHVLKLEESQILEFIDKQVLNNGEEEDFINKLKLTVINRDNKGYIEYLQIPLLLSMFILTFKFYPELPRTKNKFYWQVFNTLTTKHDSIKKAGYVHDKKSKLLNDDLEKILKGFCYKALMDYKFVFDSHYLCNSKFIGGAFCYFFK